MQRHTHSLNTAKLAAIAAALVAVFAAGCGNKDDKKPATQIIAKVDGQEISVHQLNAALAKSSGITPENLTKAKHDVLDKLVEQQIVINQASERKLDRSPDVVTAIEGAKREIIARAFIDQIASSQTKPTPEEAKKVYAERPELFAQRKIYSLQEIGLSKTANDLPAIRDKVAAAKSMEEIATWLKSKNIAFAPNGGTRTAEQIPLDVLPKLHQFKDGQIGMIDGKDSAYILRVVATQSAPVDETQALPKIQLFLANQRSVEAIQHEISQLKAKAKVEYLGEFAGGEKALKAKLDAEAAAKAKADAEAQTKVKADTDARNKAKADAEADADARAAARVAARTQAEAEAKAKDQAKPGSAPAAINLEQGIKALK